VRPDQPSVTADRVAQRRGAHQLLDRPPVFVDPLATRIIGRDAAAVLAANPRYFETSPIASYLRAFVAVRSRIAEDALAAAVARGVRQYVILGAGLDTFAYRNPHSAESLRVFEVDHPDTQAWKRRRLDEAGIPVPSDLVFVPVDFERQSLAGELQHAGLDAAAPAFFSWLGVTPYLELGDVMAVLRFVAAFPNGSGIVLDYAILPSLLSFGQRLVVAALARRVAAAGEPFRTYFDPAVLAADMRAAGFVEIEDLSPDVINARYFSGRDDGLRVGSAARIVIGRR
jgi:methyltransferase (TIGR00027 family)